jgi:hypothetical protein
MRIMVKKHSKLTLDAVAIDLLKEEKATWMLVKSLCRQQSREEV